MKNFNGYKIIKTIGDGKFLVLNTFGRQVLFMGNSDDSFGNLETLVRVAHLTKTTNFRYWLFNKPYEIIHKFKVFKDLETQFPEYLL